MIKIAPSILAADPLELGKDAARMVAAGCDWLHVDVMDAHFVPNLSFSPPVAAALRKRFPTLFLDVHLMMDQPEKYLDAFIRAGADSITVHAEIGGAAEECLKTLRSRGVRTGVALKPATPAAAVRHLLPLADMVLVMTVEPGFGGQAFMTDMLQKLTDLRGMGYAGLLEADGGIRTDNLQLLIDRGLDVAVMGTALFRADDPAALMAQLHAMRPAD